MTLLITIALLLDGLWAAVPRNEEWKQLDKPALMAWAQAVDDYYPGFEWKPGTKEVVPAWTVDMDCMRSGAGIRKCIIPDGYQTIWRGAPNSYTVSFGTIPGAGSGWLGATMAGVGGCKRSIMINQVMRYPSNPFHATPMWYEVAAHEFAHMQQSGHCNAYVADAEFGAMVQSYTVLYNMAKHSGGDYADEAWAAFVYSMRRDAILAAMAQIYREEGKAGVTAFLDQLELSRPERLALDKVNYSRLLYLDKIYYGNFFARILADEDGIFEGAGFPHTTAAPWIEDVLGRALLLEAIQ